MGLTTDLVLAERGTGTGMPDWLSTQLVDTRVQTAQPLAVRVIYVGTSLPSESSAGITDANAQKRFGERDISGMAQSLSRLALAAKLVVPGLRDMTQEEKSALRHYYRGLYRKA
jgi:hypothetical protein